MRAGAFSSSVWVHFRRWADGFSSGVGVPRSNCGVGADKFSPASMHTGLVFGVGAGKITLGDGVEAVMFTPGCKSFVAVGHFGSAMSKLDYQHSDLLLVRF